MCNILRDYVTLQARVPTIFCMGRSSDVPSFYYIQLWMHKKKIKKVEKSLKKVLTPYNYGCIMKSEVKESTESEVTIMKYTITGTFLNGESWEDTAKNKKELEFVLEQAFNNDSITKGSVRVINNKNEDITSKIIGTEETW